MGTDIERQINALSTHADPAAALAALRESIASLGTVAAEDGLVLARGREQLALSGQWQMVVDLADLELQYTEDDSRRADLLLVKGRVLQDELLDDQGAIRAFEGALAVRPEDQQTREVLEHIKLVRNNWRRIADKYTEEAEGVTEPQLATSLFLSAAEVVWRNDPGNEEVEQLLRRSLEVEPRNRRGSALLERHLRSEGRHDALVELLEQRADVASGREDRVTAWIALGDLWSARAARADLDDEEAFECENRAVDAFRHALALDPARPRPLGYMTDLLTKRNEPAALARLYEDALRVQAPAEHDAEMLAHLGDIYSSELQQPEAAERHFRRVRKLKPSDRRMLAFYRRWHRRRGELAKLLALLDNAQRSEQDALVRLELAREMAEIAEDEVGNVDKAIDVWKAVLRMDVAVTGSRWRPEAVAALKRLYRNSDPPKWNALRELLKEEADALPHDWVDEKIDLLREIVDIYRDHLELPVMVVNTYKEILALRPDHTEALRALTERYESLGRWNDLIAVLGQRAQYEIDPTAKVDLLRKVAHLWLDKLGNQGQAVAPLEEILAIDPLEPHALEQLREIHSRRRDWRALIDQLRAEVRHRPGQQRVPILREMAQIAYDRLGNTEEATRLWNEVLEQKSDDAGALAALVDVYRDQQRWDDVAGLLASLHKVNASDERRSLELLEQLAEVYTDRLRDTDRAVAAWQQVLLLRKNHPKAVAVLRELLARQQRWDDLESLLVGRGDHEDLVETLTSAADRAKESDVKVRLYARVGQLCADTLGSPERAIKAFERVLAVEPHHTAALWALVPLYRGTERWSRLLTAFETLAELVQDRSEQLTVLGALRRLCEDKLGSRTQAFHWCVRAFALAPEEPGLSEELERLAQATDGWEDLISAYARYLAEIDDVAHRLALLRRLAGLCADQLHRPDRAEPFYRQLLEIKHDDRQALAALLNIYGTSQRWADLVDIYDRQAALAMGSEAAELLFKAAFVQEERLADIVGAIATYKRIVSAGAGDVLRALRALERLYTVGGDWERVNQVLQQQYDHAPTGDRAVDLLYRQALVLQERLQRREASIERLASALQQDPHHRGCVSALEAHFAEDGSHRTQVARLLLPVYERADDFAKLAKVLQALLLTADPSERGGILERLQLIYERRLSDAARALQVSELRFLDQPEHADRRADMLRLAEATGDYERAARALKRGLDAVALADGDAEHIGVGAEVDLRWDLARVLAEELGDSVEAEVHLRRVATLDPSRVQAFSLLEKMLRDQARWTELRDVLRVRADLAADANEQREILLQICALNEDMLDDDQGAMAAYEEIKQLHPGDREVFLALERHYRAAQRWPELARLYADQLAFVANDDLRQSLMMRQAEVRAQHLHEPEAAVDLLDRLLKLAPHSDEALQLLSALLQDPAVSGRVSDILRWCYEERGQWSKLIEILQFQCSAGADAPRKVALLHKIAVIQRDRLGNPRAAYESCAAALELQPADGQLHALLDQLIRTLSLWEEGVQTWKGVIERLPVVEYRGLRCELWRKIGEVQYGQLQALGVSAGSYEVLLSEATGHDELAADRAIDALVGIYEEIHSWLDLVRVLRLQLGRTQDDAQIWALLLRLGQVQEEYLEDWAGAIDDFEELLRRQPDSIEALDALERLHMRQGSWAELVGLLQHRVSVVSDAEDRRELWRRIADLQENVLESVDDAMATYQTVLQAIPADEEALRALARLYRSTERWQELHQIVQRQRDLAVEKHGDPSVHVDLLFQEATLLQHQLMQVEAALERYGEVITWDSNHTGTRVALEQLLEQPEFALQVAAILEPLFEREEQWDQLAHILEIRQARTQGTERVAMLARLGALHQQRRSDDQPAFDAYRRALLVEPGADDPTELVQALRRLAERTGRWEECVEVLEQLVDRVTVASLRRMVRRFAGQISREYLKDLPRAADHYRHLAEDDYARETALEALHQIYREQQDWAALLDVVLRRVEVQVASDARVEFLLEAAALCGERLGQPEQAIGLLERVRQAEPRQSQAIEQLGALYAEAERWEDLAILLQFQADCTEDRQRQVGLICQLARIAGDHLSDHERALDAYGKALRIDPGCEEAVAALEVFLGQSELRERAAAVLEPHYGAKQDWRRLIYIYELRLGAEREPDERRRLSTRVAQLYEEQLEDLGRAFDWYGRVFVERPADLAIREQLLRLAGVLDRWRDAVGYLERYLDETTQYDETYRTVAMLAGEICDEKLYSWHPAKKNFDRILAQNPADEEVLARLERLLVRHERWSELLEHYEESLDRTMSASERCAVMIKMARVWEESVADIERAIEVYRHVLSEVDGHSEANAALERLYQESGRWEDLCDLLHRKLGLAQDERERTALKYRLGQVHEEQLQKLSTAVDHYEEVLRADPQHQETIAVLERLLLDRDQRHRIAQLLGPIYREQDDWAKLIVIYETELDYVDDAERRVMLLREIATLHEQRGGAPDLAFAALCRAFREESDPVRADEVLEQIERLAQGLSSWRDVVEVLSEVADHAYDHVRKAALLSRVAHLQEQQLEDEDAAIAAWRKVLALREDHRDAIAALRRLYEQAGRYDELVEIMERHVELSPDPEDQLAAYASIAATCEIQLGDTSRAAEAWRHVLELDENDADALQALGRLYEANEDWLDLVWVYQHELEHVRSEQRWSALQLAIARIYEQNLDDTFEAIATYKVLAARFPHDPVADRALERLYTQEGLWTDLLETLENRARRADDRTAAAALHQRVGELLADKIGDMSGAVDRFERLLADDPGYEPARAALETLLDDPAQRDRVAQVLQRAYQTLGDNSSLVRVLRARLDVMIDPMQRCDLLCLLARVQEEELGDAKAAFATLGRALAENPVRSSIQDALERLAAQLGLDSELSTLYEGQLAAIYQPDERRRLHLKLAKMFAAEADQIERAEEHYRSALQCGGEESAILEALERLLREQGKHHELLDVLEQRADLAPDADQQAEMRFRLGELRLHRAGDPEGAFGAFREALELQPRHEGALQAMLRLCDNEELRGAALDVLEPIFETSGDAAMVVRLCEIRLEILTNSVDRSALLVRMAHLKQERLNAPEQAFSLMLSALHEDPANRETLDELERLAPVVEGYQRLAESAEQLTDEASSLPDEVERELSLRSAAWYLLRLGDSERALHRYHKLVERYPDCLAALDALESVYRRSGDYRELADVLERRAAVEYDVERKRRLLREIAQLREEQVEDLAAAVEAWRGILALEPASIEAIDALSRLYEASGAWEEYLAILERREVLASQDAAARVSLRLQAAGIVERQLRDLDRAVEIYRDVLDLAPANTDAIDALERIHRARRDWLSVRDVLVQRIEAVGRERVVDIYRELARLSHEQIGDIDDAIGYYQQVYALDPEDCTSFAQLEKLLRQGEKWYELIDLFNQESTRRLAVDEVDEAVRLQLAMARVWTDHLGNPDMAAEVLEETLSRAPNSVSALVELSRLYQVTDRWELSHETLVRAAKLEPQGSDAAELAYRRGRLLAQQGADDEDVLSCYHQALALDSTHTGAAERLEEAARSRDDWKTVGEMLELRSQHSDDQERLAALTELAQVQFERLDDPQAAVASWELVRELEPDDRDVQYELARARCAAGQLERAEEDLQQLLVQPGGRQRTQSRYYHLQGVIAEQRGESAAALQCYERAHRADSTNGPTLAALGRLYCSAERWEDAGRVYRSMLLQSPKPDWGMTRADIFCRLGRVYSAMGDAEKARNMFERGLEADPTHAELNNALQRVKTNRP